MQKLYVLLILALSLSLIMVSSIMDRFTLPMLAEITAGLTVPERTDATTG